MGILYFDKKDLFSNNGFQKIIGKKLEMWESYEISSKEVMQLCKSMKEPTFGDALDSTKTIIISAPLFVNEKHDGFYVLFDGENEFIPWTPTNSEEWFDGNDIIIRSSGDPVKMIDLNILRFMFSKCTRAGFESFKHINPDDNIQTQLEKFGVFVNTSDFEDKFIVIYHEDECTGIGMLFFFRVIPIIDDSALYPMYQITIYDLQRMYNSGVLNKDDACCKMPILDRFKFALNDTYIEKIDSLPNFPFVESISYWDSLIVPLTKSSVIKGSLRL